MNFQPIKLHFVILSVLSLTFLSGCGLFFGSDAKDEPPPSQSAEVPIEAVVASVGVSLRAAGFSDAEAASIKAGALDSARAATSSSSTDYDTLIPAAIEGAMTALGTDLPDMTAERKIRCVGAISEGFITALKGRYESTGMSARAVDAPSVAYILERISKAAVANLARTGIDPSRRSEAAGQIVASIVGSLDDGGVDRTLVNTALGKICTAAVGALADAGLSSPEAANLAVLAIAKGAVSGISNAAIPGISTADMPSMVSAIASGTASALGSLSTDVSAISALAGSIASGAAEGIVAMKAGDASMTPAEITSMLSSVASGTTSGAMSLVDPASSGASLIGAITSGASKALNIGAAALDVSPASIANEIAKGAAAAAQTSIPGGMSGADLALAIKITDAGGATVTADIAAAISQGIILGNNKSPIADAGATDRTIQVGTPISFDATASSDAEDDASSTPLDFAWTLVKPTGSASALTAVTGQLSSFTPDIAGFYIVTVRVTDSNGAFDLRNISVTAIADQSDPLYLGKTASDRLTAVRLLMDSQDMPAARDELVLLLGHYPQTPLFAEAYFLLGRVYQKMDYPVRAFAQFDRAIALYPTEPMGYKALLERAWMHSGGKPDKAKTDFEKVKADRSGTLEEAVATMGLGLIELNKKNNNAAARALFEAADSHPAADLGVRWNSRLWIAQSWTQETPSDMAQAIAETGKLEGEARYFREDPADPATFSGDAWFEWHLKIADGYVGMGANDSAIPILNTLKNDTKLKSRHRLIASRRIGEIYLWHSERNPANLALALENVLYGLTNFASGTTVSDQWAIAETLVRKGQVYENLVWALSDKADRDAAYQNSLNAFDAAIVYASGKWYCETMRAYAMDSKAGISLWYGRNYAMAESLCLSVINTYSPEFGNQEPKAGTSLRLAQVYMERGWDAKKSTAVDHVLLFERALALFSKVTPAYFPTIRETEWYFREAYRNAARCYAGLGNFTLAKAKYLELVANAAYSAADRAWMQKEYADILGDETRDLLHSNLSFTASYAAMKAAYAKVATIRDQDGSYPENGRGAAEAWAQEAGYALDIGAVLDMEKGNYAEGEPYYQDAVTAGSKVTAANFPALAAGEWAFLEGPRRRAEALVNLSQYAAARTIYSELLAKVTAGTFGDTNGPNIKASVARSYKREADKLPVTSAAEYAAAVSLYDLAIAANRAVLDDNGFALDPVTCAWSLNEICWAIWEKQNRLAWWNWTAKPDYPTMKTEILALADETHAVFVECAALRSGGAIIENGRPAAGALSVAGLTLSAYANFLGNGGDADKTERIQAYRDAIALGDIMDSYPSADRWNSADMRRLREDSYFSLFDLENKVSDFIAGEDHGYLLISNPDADAIQTSRAIISLGNAYLNFGPALVALGTHPHIKTAANWRSLAELQFDLILDSYASTAEADVIQSAQNGLDWLAANPE